MLEHKDTSSSGLVDRVEERVFEYAPLEWARAFIASQYTDTGTGSPCLLLYHWRGDFWRYNGICYEIKERQTLRKELYHFLERCLIMTKDGPDKANPVSGDIEKFIDAVEVEVHRESSEEAPSWVDGTPPELLELPTGELLVCTNGILHIPTRRLLDPTPRLFATSILNVRYDANAPTPSRWMQFLDEVWSNDEVSDPETILALQLIFAYLLSGYTKEQKVIFFVGVKRSGKGTIARLLTALFGRDMVCNPTFQSIGERFGGENLIGKSIAIVGDARLSGRTDIQACVERLLSISGEDCQSIQRKNKTDWNGRLGVRFLILSNEVPQLTDASATIASRMIALRFSRSFYGKEDKNLEQDFIPELPGILNWALDGFDAMQGIGLIQPQSALEDIRQMEELASPIKTFIDEHVGFDSNRFWFCKEAFDSWKWFCGDTYFRPGNMATFGKNLKAALHKIDRGRRDNPKTGKRDWAYLGLYPKS